MRRALTILTLSVGLLAFPGTALAERDKDRASASHSYDGNHKAHEKAHKKVHGKHHWKRSYHDKKYQAEKHRHRITTYRHFSGHNYTHWRERRIHREHPGYRELRRHYYAPHHDRYRSHYRRYHRGHKHSHHQHDDNYLEWVTTMLLLNELLDDEYSYR